MFEKIVLRRSENGPSLTAGDLAEALLFYQNVHLVLDYGSFCGLVKQIGMPALVSLISRQNVSAVYCENSLATYTETKNNISTYAFTAFSFAGGDETGPLRSRKKLLEHILINKFGYEKKHARRLFERFRLKATFRDLTANHFIEGGIVLAAQKDLSDEFFIRESARLSFEELVGVENIPQNFRFKAIPNDKGFYVDTNIDFAKISEIAKLRGTYKGDFTAGLVMSNTLNARADTILASYYGGEFSTSKLSSSIIQLKHSELLRRIGIEKGELEEFTEIVIGDAPTLREVINSNERSFDEFLRLLDKSERFREWARGVNPDGKLVKEYWGEVSSKGWIERLPSKTLRYVIGNIFNAIDPVTAQAISFADAFILDKVAGGWRPNHFVDKKLVPFLNERK